MRSGAGLTPVRDAGWQNAPLMAQWLRRPRFTLPAVLMLFTALAVLVKLDVWASPLTRFTGSADAEQMMWFLSWPPFAVSHHMNPLLSNYINYPTGFNLLWNTTMPALGLLLWPITAIWGAIATYNVIMTAAMALSAFFAFIAIRRYVHNDLAALAGGLLFGFSPAVIAQEYGHAQVAFSAITIPLTLLIVDELLVRQRLPTWLMGVLTAALGVFQFFVFQEFFATEIMAALIVAAVLAFMYRPLIRERSRYVLRSVGIGAALAALVLAYPIIAIQLGGPDRIHGVIHDPNLFSTDLLNPVMPTPLALFAPRWVTAISARFSQNPSEADGYIGIPLLVLSLFVVVRYWRVPVIRVAAVTAVVIGILSLGPHLEIAGHNTKIPLPWWPVSQLPLVGNILPSRMMYFVYLPLGIGLAFLLDRMWVARRNWIRPVLVAAVALVPLLPSLPFFDNTLTIPSYFRTSAVEEIPAGAVVYAMPFPQPWAMDPMNWQFASRMRFRLIGGYVLGPLATGQDGLQQVANAFAGASPPPAITPDQRAEFLREVRSNRVGAVIVGPVTNQSAAIAFCTDALGSRPHVSDGLAVWVLPSA